MAKNMIVKKFTSPDETRPFRANGRLDVLRIGDVTVGRGVFEPGWRWSTHVKPIAGTASCQAAHQTYVLAGRLHIAMDDGQEMDLEPGDYAVIPPGHDAWTLGDEACVMLDFSQSAAEQYARPAEEARAPAGPASPAHH